MYYNNAAKVLDFGKENQNRNKIIRKPRKLNDIDKTVN